MTRYEATRHIVTESQQLAGNLHIASAAGFYSLTDSSTVLRDDLALDAQKRLEHVRDTLGVSPDAILHAMIVEEPQLAVQQPETFRDFA